MHHCPSNCHQHTIQSFSGVAGGSFTAPDHEYPSHLELRLTATDAGGLTDIETLELDPQTVDLTFASSPAGLQLVVGSTAAHGAVHPHGDHRLGELRQRRLAADARAVDATRSRPGPTAARRRTRSPRRPPRRPTPRPSRPRPHRPRSSPRTRSTPAAAPRSPTSPAAATPARSPARPGPTAGRNGGALSFDGVNDWVTVADTAALDLTNGDDARGLGAPSVDEPLADGRAQGADRKPRLRPLREQQRPAGQREPLAGLQRDRGTERGLSCRRTPGRTSPRPTTAPPSAST